VSGQALADELGVSLRTIYRDIQRWSGKALRSMAKPGLASFSGRDSCCRR
jgi:predicted DNA-binding transcriptional regulator YafY